MKHYDFSELSKLIKINSYTKNKAGVDTVGNIYKELFTFLGFDAHTHKRDTIGNHLHFKSTQKQGKKLLLLGHMDTVFPAGTFEGFKEDEKWIYGPGVCDMKGGNHVALEALRNLHANLKTIHNIDVLLVSDEETGSDDSRELTTALAKEYEYALVFEAAGKNDEVVVGRKGVATYTIEIEGLAKHAGNHYDKGIDANLELAHKTIKLIKLTDLPQGTTVNVGKIEGGIGANTISPKARLLLEARFTCTNERDRVVKEIERIASHSFTKGAKSLLQGGLQRDVMEPSEKTYDFIKKLENILGFKLQTESRGGVSDANIVSCNKVITLDGWGPFGDGDHTIHERALKKSFIKRVEQVSKILLHFSQNGYKF